MSVQKIVQEALLRSPSPPRAVHYRRVLVGVLGSSLGFAGLAFGLVLLTAAFGFFITPGGIVPTILGATFLAVGIFVAFVPLVYARRVRRAVAIGIIGEAEITRLDVAEGPGRRTLDAMSQGYVAGERCVHHPRGDFTEPFRYDGVGASRLHVGSRMRMLLEPERKRVLLDLPLDT